MDLITSLGIDSTVFIQLAIFIFTYFVLVIFVFKPYMNAYKMRESLTIGSEDQTEELLTKTQDLHYKFKSKAQKINDQIKSIYDSVKLDAYKEYDGIINRARNEADEFIEDKRSVIHTDLNKAKSELAVQVPQISRVVVEKLVGKEMSQ